MAALTATGLASAASPAAHPGGAPDFGPDVFVYDPSTPATQIQAKLDELFARQESNEMGTNRYAVTRRAPPSSVRTGRVTSSATPDLTGPYGTSDVVSHP